MSADEPFLSLAADQSPAGREAFADTLSRLRHETGIFAVKTSSMYAGLYISIAVVILVVVFLYMLYYGKDADERIVVYSSAVSIGLLVASDVSI